MPEERPPDGPLDRPPPDGQPPDGQPPNGQPPDGQPPAARPVDRSRRRLLRWITLGGALGAGAVALRQYMPFNAQRSPQPRDLTRGPTPREGAGAEEPEIDVDEAHRQRVEAFPAATEGYFYPLEYRWDGDWKVFELETRVVQWEVEPGVRREAWTYNGVAPGPEIRVTEGNRVRVLLHNRLPESTSIHFHGQYLKGYNGSDGVTYLTTPPTKPGATSVYEFVAEPPGSHMYHSHHDSTKQLAMGLLGPLIVEPRQQDMYPPYDQEVILILNDGPLGFTINGKSFPATRPVRAKLGDKVLLRWMNEGAMLHPMHLHGQIMEVVARDGHPLPAPWRLDTVSVAPGERWDTIVHCVSPGAWAIHCHVLPHAEGEMGLMGLTTVFIVEK